jgi:GNAT superfamily N-acetyltransferase
MIRRANNRDIEAIMGIISDAQAALRELGIDQWQGGYPTAEIIERDIESNAGYVYVEDNIVVGYAAIVLTGEIAYKQIDEHVWGTREDYVVVHRLCVGKDFTRKGIALSLMRKAKELAIEAGYSGFRIDTHRGNVRMLSMMDRLGFEYRGIIHYDSGERLAYDLKFNSNSIL